MNDWRKSTTSRTGGHRKECAQNNQEFLKSLPEPFDVRCPTCFSYLKLLPKVRYAFHSHKSYTMILQLCYFGIQNQMIVKSNSFQECGKTFKCDDLSCAFTKETTSTCFSRTKFKPQSIRNNGMNRLSCFSCDHDICDR